ncbi:hypothetical protein VMCG_04928 [Cytospora schulzeri]|uniref:Uncharacterized protein n=1 Tax=Cytospora schulzeri TaxID=448051 RepID=A0A423WN75_9PEZI|nr:hypothetical protein VMCG_04928 [Valsa malicola]
MCYRYSLPTSSYSNSGGGDSLIFLKEEDGEYYYCCGDLVANGDTVGCAHNQSSFTVGQSRLLFGYAALADATQSTATISVSVSGTTGAATTSATSSSSSDSPAPTDSGWEDNGTKIGVAVGVPLGVVALLAVAWGFWERRRRVKAQSAAEHADHRHYHEALHPDFDKLHPPGTSVSLFNGNPAEMRGSVMMINGISMDDGSSAETFDWVTYDAMDFDTLLPQPFTEEHRPSQDGSTNPATFVNGSANSASSDGLPKKLEDTRSECTKRLTDLLLDTDKLWARLLLSSALHIPRNDPHEVYLKALTEKATTKNILENLFKLAQQLIDIYSPATDLIFSNDADSLAACRVPDCTHEVDLPPALRELEGQTSGRGRQTAEVDAALANLLVSCHIRLLDVLDRVFLLITSCTRVTLASPERREPDFDVAEIRVGSFVPQRNAAVLMQIVLLKHLMVCLSVKLVSLGQAIVARTGQFGEEGLEMRILTLQHKALAERHARQIEHIGTIEEFLSDFDSNKI